MKSGGGSHTVTLSLADNSRDEDCDGEVDVILLLRLLHLAVHDVEAVATAPGRRRREISENRPAPWAEDVEEPKRILPAGNFSPCFYTSRVFFLISAV